ncbi:NAD-dependent epimerase/dehydratase family protein [Salinibacter altiplanensis]|uniref:NAD-dependent epimerase/dehydratase family protein n=1 Tax=Salinibacter altiplanensis TaxID=1803181 RepID=UPI000C9F99DF|nr:NAD-dependent epimerase/dehydratase family protein [Salinibacter altiplanensis]
MRVLVTGAAGFIGSHLAEALADAGHDVTGLDALTGYYDRSLKRNNVDRLAARGIETARLDLAADPLGPVLDGIEGVYHLAAQPGLSPETDRRAFVRNNVRATERLLDALAGHPQLRAFLFASSSSVYGREATAPEDAALAPVSVYGRTKRRAEAIVRARAEPERWDSCVLRLFSVYGPRERPDKLIPKALRCARRGQAFPLFEGSEHHRRSFTYVGDVVEGLVTALDRFPRCAGEVINLGAPSSTSTLRVLERVAEVVGRPLCIERRPARPGDQQCTRACIEKARRLLGFAPTTSLRDGIVREADWVGRTRIG